MSEPSTDRPVRDPLAEALFPVLVHRLNNATQVLSSLNAVLAADLDDSLLEGSSTDLAEASQDVHELGWLLGVLASAGGANLLLERREESGLTILTRALRDGLRRQGRDLEQREGLPALVPDGDGWQTPWAIGSVLWSAGNALAREETLRWSLEEHGAGWRLECASAPRGDALTSLAARLAGALPDASFTTTDDASTLVLPAGLLRKS
jgi:hypothetical protein